MYLREDLNLILSHHHSLSRLVRNALLVAILLQFDDEPNLEFVKVMSNF
jgi:hypothetical protein